MNSEAASHVAQLVELFGMPSNLGESLRSVQVPLQPDATSCGAYAAFNAQVALGAPLSEPLQATVFQALPAEELRTDLRREVDRLRSARAPYMRSGAIAPSALGSER
eukprot:342650-Lingulodinium_polyedra.AAC.1